MLTTFSPCSRDTLFGAWSSPRQCCHAQQPSAPARETPHHLNTGSDSLSGLTFCLKANYRVGLFYLHIHPANQQPPPKLPASSPVPATPAPHGRGNGMERMGGDDSHQIGRCPAAAPELDFSQGGICPLRPMRCGDEWQRRYSDSNKWPYLSCTYVVPYLSCTYVVFAFCLNARFAATSAHPPFHETTPSRGGGTVSHAPVLPTCECRMRWTTCGILYFLVFLVFVLTTYPLQPEHLLLAGLELTTPAMLSRTAA